jgi:predicted enzyme related to lactoylglutathione lyase
MSSMASLLTEIVIESQDPRRAAEFWSAALDWDLREYMPGNVPWISASGDPEQHDLKLVFVPARQGNRTRNRLYLNPTGCDLDEEIERLCGLGAVTRSTRTGADENAVPPWVALTDPGATGFTILPNRMG